ncbi:MAG: TonB-dependent receptor, partial [Tannerellaceae bacterium]|nr:TonB-dependent receptor [Tannerellaceae bacterium]
YQKNGIGGYGFLLPRYQRETAGAYYMASFFPAGPFSFSGGFRFDYGHIRISPFEDTYLESYLQQNGYSRETVEFYKQRSFETDRSFANYAGSIGVVYTPSERHIAKVNIGRSFRLPGANELASNGVHHGTFRHEQGDATLNSEQGWQLDMGYTFHGNSVRLEVSPFISWFTNYIYLQPTGEWSILPHAGQIYKYSGVEALFTGGEISGEVDILHEVTLAVSGEYVYTYNLDANTALSFSPPVSLRSTLSYHPGQMRFYLENECIAAQNRISRNEDPTPGAQLFHAGASFSIPWMKNKLEVTISANNLFDTRYYNHLSFYRKIDIPEPGRNFQLLIKIPFKTLLK